MTAAEQPYWTPKDYLAFERTSDQKHEYLDGEIFAMAGASARHNIILANTIANLHAQLRKRDCTVYPSDLRVSIPKSNTYTYPDITIVCGTPQFEDDERDILLNPTVIVEILSDSTERYDRGGKFQRYRRLDSLQEYVLISQDSQRIEVYHRLPDDRWILSDTHEVNSAISLESVGCTLALADVYEKVSLEEI